MDGTYGSGTFWNSGDTPIALANYYASALIPVTVGVTYTINNCRSYQRHNSTGGFITGSYVDNPSMGAISVTIAAGTSYVAYNVHINLRTDSQMEIGATGTAWEPYGLVVYRQIGNHGVTVANAVQGLLATTGITVYRDGDDMLLRTGFDDSNDLILPICLSRGDESQLMMQTDTHGSVCLVPAGTAEVQVWPVLLTGTAIHLANDDNAPIAVNWGGHIAGNHGWPAGSTVTLVGHDKTTSDLGSIWTDGTRQYTLLAIPSSSALLFGGPYTLSSGVVVGDTTLPSTTLTHVSGATHTSSVSIAGGVALTQIHPSSHSHAVTALLDGRPFGDGRSNGQALTFKETYTVVSYKGLIDTARANIGTSVFTLLTSCPSFGTVTNTYRFTGKKQTICQRFAAEEKVTVGLKATQFAALNTLLGSDVVRQFIPGVGVVGGNDFRTYVDLAAVTVDANITPVACLDPTDPPKSATQWVHSLSGVPRFGMALGYLPVDDSTPQQRVKNASAQYWQIRASSKKSYPQIGYSQTLNAGETVQGTAFREYLAPGEAAATHITMTDGARTWAQVDRVATTTGASMDIPTQQGSVLRQVGRSTLTLERSTVGAGGIRYAAPAAPGYGMFELVPPPTTSTQAPGSCVPVGKWFAVNRGALSTTTLPISGRLYLWPLLLPEDAPVDRIAVEVTTPGTGVVRIGLFPADPATGWPAEAGPLVDMGTIDPTGAGIKELTLTGVTVPASGCWVGLAWQGTSTTSPTLRCLAGVVAGPLTVGTSSAALSTATMGVYAAAAGALGAITVAGTHDLPVPQVGFRRA
jgi:hypothetical protein